MLPFIVNSEHLQLKVYLKILEICVLVIIRIDAKITTAS